MSALKLEMKRIRRQHRTREIVRFWFEIYQALKCNAYLRETLRLESALQGSEQKYRLWGNVTGTTEFEQWWKEHRESFIEAPSVQVLTSDKIERKPKHLYLSISLEKAPTKLLAALKGKIQQEQARQGMRLDGQKQKFRRQAAVRYNEATQIHLPSFREEYRFFRYFYIRQLFGPDAKHEWLGDDTDAKYGGIELWKKAADYYQGKKKPKFLKFSKTPTGKQRASALKALRRYIKRLELYCERVASGQFP